MIQRSVGFVIVCDFILPDDNDKDYESTKQTKCWKIVQTKFNFLLQSSFVIFFFLFFFEYEYHLQNKH